MPTYGFTGTVNDLNFARMQALSGARVGVESSTAWAPTATVTDRTVSLAAGNGLLPGLRHETTSAATVQCAANASGSTRFDLIVARANFTAKTVTFTAITGTPGAGAPPAASRTLLATGVEYDFPIVVCRVISGGGAFTAATDLFDVRLWGGLGGPYTVAQESFASNVHQLVQGSVMQTPDGATAWRRTASGWDLIRQRVLAAGTSSAIVLSGISSSVKTLNLYWVARGTAAQVLCDVRLRVNGTSGANYVGNFTRVVSSTATSFADYSGGAVTSAHVGSIPAASAAAGNYGAGVIRIPGWSTWSTGRAGLNWTWSAHAWENVGNSVYGSGGGYYFGIAGPYTSLTLMPDVGQFAAGTEFGFTSD